MKKPGLWVNRLGLRSGLCYLLAMQFWTHFIIFQTSVYLSIKWDNESTDPTGLLGRSDVTVVAVLRKLSGHKSYGAPVLPPLFPSGIPLCSPSRQTLLPTKPASEAEEVEWNWRQTRKPQAEAPRAEPCKQHAKSYGIQGWLSCMTCSQLTGPWEALPPAPPAGEEPSVQGNSPRELSSITSLQ